MDDLKNIVEKAVCEAGEFFLDISKNNTYVTKSGTANFATYIDYTVQEYMVKKLDEIMPGSNIITEESDKNEYTMVKPTWILDPVDGTINIANDFRHSAVSLALFIDGKPELGVIYNPYSKEMFTGQSRKGASLNGRPINVSRKNSLSDSLMLFGTTPYDRSQADHTFNIVKEVFLKSRDIRRSGSAALDIAYVASGRADGFFELCLQPWDFAAGMIILNEAGGVMTRWDGKPVDVLHPTSMLATNGFIHTEMLGMLKK